MEKNTIAIFLGILGSAVASAFGGWDTAMTTLMIFMGVDYVTGLLVAGVFKSSPKSNTGALESKAGWKGLCRKGMTLLIILIASRLDAAIGSAFIKDAAVIAYIINETVSILENAGLMGLPVPKAVQNAVEALKSSPGGKGE